MACLISRTKEQQDGHFPLGRRTNVIGRAENLSLQILDDMVSRKHLQIRFDRSRAGYFALDMHSRNGVHINGGRISAETRLRDGDWIMLGNTLLLFSDRDFADAESALHHYKKTGEMGRLTRSFEH